MTVLLSVWWRNEGAAQPRQEKSEGSCILVSVIPSLKRSIGCKYRHRRIPSAMELHYDQPCRTQPELDVTIGKPGIRRGALTKLEEVAKKSRPSAKRTHEQGRHGLSSTVFS